MGGMTDQEARNWCSRHGIPVGHHGPETSRLGSGVLFCIPDESAARVQLSQLLYPTTFEIPGSVLLWTGDWGVWPSGEHMPLFTRFREALGETRPLSEANAHEFDAPQSEDGESLLLLHCLFLWDCWVIAEGGTYIAFFCHDEWGQVFAEPPLLEKVREYLTQLGFITQ